MQFYVGAYASSPNGSQWDSEVETNYYARLKEIPLIKGLEHPFVGTLHPHDDQWFLDNISKQWDFVFTCVPGIMGEIGKNPHFGIASDNEDGRQAALRFMQKACEAVAKLNQHAQKSVVRAVQIQTAPNRSVASGSQKALRASLLTMLEWDWQGAQLVIEHCDSLVEGQVPAKGFLSLDDEIAALKAVNLQASPAMGIVINWGRSVLETRSVEGAVEHINASKNAHLLSGVMFSGVSDKDSEYGTWKDTHMPPAASPTLTHGAIGSLMTEQQMHRCVVASELHISNTQNIVGIKLGIRPTTSSLNERMLYIQDALQALARCWST